MSNIDTLLKDIITSTKSTKSSVEDLITYLQQAGTSHPELVENLIKKSSHSSKLEGVSLLTLKNESLAAYINNLILIVLAQLERLEKDDDDNNNIEDKKLDVVKRSIVQRVTFEKGVKPLEKKLNYQLDKMVRAYGRMEQDELKAQQKLDEEENDKKNDDDEDEDEDDEDSDEDDNLQYRPDASALAKLASFSSKSKKSSTQDSTSDEKYKPPKISAMAPPTAISQKDIDAKSSSGKNRKVQSMEEYLQEQSDLPTVDASIGSTIIAHGRGGVKTAHDRKKEKEVQDYEENNFVRLPTNQTKKSFKEKQRDLRNQFAGEDWSMFNNKDVTKEGTSRKRKAGTVWDRVKKKKGY